MQVGATKVRERDFQPIWRVVMVMIAIAIAIAIGLTSTHTPGVDRAQNIVWIKDMRDLPGHQLRGEALAKRDLKAGQLNFYISICTFPAAFPETIRAYEIRQSLYRSSGITVKANLCNDVIPNAVQQEAFVAGYNAVMGMAIATQLGAGWEESLEKQVSVQQRKHPKGKLRAQDIDFETPY
jgi:hypothetical protein